MNDLEKALSIWAVGWPTFRKEVLRPDCCIAASTIAVKAAKMMGFHAYAVATDVIYLNYDATLALAKDIPTDKWPHAAWSVGMNCDSEDRNTDGKRAFAGHVVAIIEGYLLDLSAEQASRPQRGLEVLPMILAPDCQIEPDRWFAEGDDDGAPYAQYNIRADVRRWKDSPDARRAHTELVELMVKVASAASKVDVP